MSEKTEDLGRRAVACKHWRWMPGTLLTNGWRVSFAERDWVGYDDLQGSGRGFNPVVDKRLPDLDDPATLGCLLALVREAWGDRGAAALHSSRDGYWTPNVGSTNEAWAVTRYPTEAEALVVALEAAP